MNLCLFQAQRAGHAIQAEPLKKPFEPITLGAIAALSVVQAGAVVLTFEDLPCAGTPPAAVGGYFQDLVNADYKGFRFGDTSSATWYWNPNPDQNPVPADNRYNASSGTVWLGNSGGNSPVITSAQAFKFDGASFAGHDTIKYELYLSGSLKATSAGCLLSNTHQFCGSGYSGLGALAFAALRCKKAAEVFAP